MVKRKIRTFGNSSSPLAGISLKMACGSKMALFLFAVILIFLKLSLQWTAQCYYKNWKGEKKHKKKRGFATKKEALEWEREFLKSTSANMDMMLGAFVDVYFRDKAGELKRDKKALPLVEKLKEVVKNLTIKCVQLTEQSKKLTAKVDGQQKQISRLTDKVMEQNDTIDRLQEKASDLGRLERHFGREQVQSIVERSKALEQAERAKKRPKRAFEMSR